MRKPEVRARILAGANGTYLHPTAQMLHENFTHMFPIEETPDLEPGKENTVVARAGAKGMMPEEFCYDHMLGNDGRNRRMICSRPSSAAGPSICRYCTSRATLRPC